MNAERLLARFLQYVQIDTTSNDEAEQYPSSPGQIELGTLLVEQLRSMSVTDAQQNALGIVTATIPSNIPRPVPVVAFNAHLDTSPETSGKGVRPNVIRNFHGNDLPLPGDPTQIIRVDTCPELADAKGHTIITSDGTTLLGGDDKAGVAILMELAQVLLESPHIPHGPVRLLFTCDEEIGRGVRHVDLEELGAAVCYTFDGSGRDEIDHETFSADLAIVTVRGTNIHPSIAKGRMINAVRGGSELVGRLPRSRAPETTEAREGFLHPYSVTGNVAQVQVRILLRDFDTARLEEYAKIVRQAAAETERSLPGIQCEVEVRRQYRNMAEGLQKDPRAVALAVEAHARLGRTARLTIVRGGTDGSQLTEKGLPTPNLSSGQHNIHSPLEWASLDEMVSACEVGVEIVRRWGEERA